MVYSIDVSEELASSFYRVVQEDFTTMKAEALNFFEKWVFMN
jgi:hypothetical protein